MKKPAIWFLIFTLLIILPTGCLKKENPSSAEAMQIVDAFVGGFSEFITLGDEYTGLGLQLQADYAYGWAAASISSMRYCTDCLLYLSGEGKTLGDVTDGRMADWDRIAGFNYATPYPWFFEGLVQHVQGNEKEAAWLYERAIMNPAFDAEYGETLKALATLNITQLKELKARLIKLEDQIFEKYKPGTNPYPRTDYCFDDTYLCLLARETLEKNETNYHGALSHFEAALKVNPFEGDIFAGCAIMCFYLNEFDKMYFYVNEGLFVDPEHDGLNQLAELMNKEAGLS